MPRSRSQTRSQGLITGSTRTPGSPAVGGGSCQLGGNQTWFCACYGCGLAPTPPTQHSLEQHWLRDQMSTVNTTTSIITYPTAIRSTCTCIRSSSMASTTPQSATPTTTQRRPSSQTRHPASRPTTPLRPPSRNSLRASTSTGPYPAGALPLETLEAQFAELSDSLSDLQDNFQYLGLMHESIGRFSENFASFLYGMNMNAFCVDFPEVSLISM